MNTCFEPYLHHSGDEHIVLKGVCKAFLVVIEGL